MSLKSGHQAFFIRRMRVVIILSFQGGIRPTIELHSYSQKSEFWLSAAAWGVLQWLMQYMYPLKNNYWIHPLLRGWYQRPSELDVGILLMRPVRVCLTKMG